MGDIREEKSASLDVTLEEIKEGIRKLQDIGNFKNCWISPKGEIFHCEYGNHSIIA